MTLVKQIGFALGASALIGFALAMIASTLPKPDLLFVGVGIGVVFEAVAIYISSFSWKIEM